MKKIFLILFCVLTLSSCSGFFYQPSKGLFYDPRKIGYETNLVSFFSRDQTKLYGWFFPARTSEVKGTIVQYHGNAQNMSTHFLSLAWITQLGYNLFIFDYRGYGPSEGEPSQEGLNDDAIAAYDYVRNHIHKPGQKLVLFGQSLGGAVLARAFHDFQEKTSVNAVVIESSFYSYQEIAREIASNHWLTWLFQPLAYVTVSEEYSPESYFKDISPIPLLVIHGTHDRVIPFSFGEHIFSLSREPKTFWRVEKGSHISSMQRHNGLYRKKLIEYLEQLE